MKIIKIRKLINKLIQSLGRKSYNLDFNLSNSELIVILFERVIQLFRGLLVRLYFQEVKGLLFIGRNCKLKFKNKIMFGKSVQLGDNVEINALSKNGVVIGNMCQF